MPTLMGGSTTDARVDAACRRIRKAGFKADVIHSGRSQNQRKKALEQFAESKIGVLIATDVLARGIDVDRVSYVVNYDLPETHEDYIHRIGRTGRAGQEGMAISFVSPENKEALKEIQKLTKQHLREIEIADYDKEKAEEEAAERSLQNSLRREKDPEVAQVMKEMAAADKAKRKKQKRAQESREKVKSRGNGHAAKGSAKQSRKQARAAQNDIVAFGEKQSGIKRKRDRAARMAEDDRYVKRVSAGRPPVKATGKAAKISAERYEARLAAVEEDHAQHRRRMKAKYSTAKGANSKKGTNSKKGADSKGGGAKRQREGAKRPRYKSSGTRKHK